MASNSAWISAKSAVTPWGSAGAVSDYDLTPLGASLHSTIKALVTWTEEHQREIAGARNQYDRRADGATLAAAARA